MNEHRIAAAPADATSDAAPEATAGPAATSEAATTDANLTRRGVPGSAEFRAFISSNWAPNALPVPSVREAAVYAVTRRAALSAEFPGERLIVPAGPAKTRSNDTEYPYRAHSAFAYYTGWGSDTEPGAVLVLEPTGEGHEATLYFREGAGRDTDEFYANAAIGEFWTGPRPSTTHVSADLGVRARDIHELEAAIAGSGGRIIRDADPALTATLDAARAAEGGGDAADAALAQFASEQRLIKDAYEIAELRAAIAATERGFTDVFGALDRATAERRGERVIEGVFDARARLEGNDVGYGSIAAAGPHATILHWTRNDGPVIPGDLVLLDAGVERDSYYTADITRTFPVNGEFTPVQRKVYEAVLEAADAAFAVVRPGIVFREVHAAAMAVIARKTAEWGFLPVSAEASLEPDAQYHRRYMVHGTSHHLGIDVHDCAQARREFYMDGTVEAGMVFTIEPGLYFQPDDLTVPAEFRGIGVRIEDDILVTETGAENLSAGIPRTVDAVEAWVRVANEVS
ncbi:MAG TPA: aminopeptidase P family protein [Candidatus Lumbricidophila sp.]|nr:aminopeptidase P family protein [Candidatus Lumbricidophila sp.]